MIVCRAPFRVSFVGGGTDFEDYYRQSYGHVISATIDKHIYVTVIRKFDGKVSLKYSQHECVDRAENLKHTLVREGLKMFGIESGVEIDIISDIPARGSGLGSSSSLASCLLQAFARYQGKSLWGSELARRACELEIDILKEPIGRQDQYAASMGGFNEYIFEPNGAVTMGNLWSADNWDKISWLERASMLFYLDGGRKAGDILREHKRLIVDFQNHGILVGQRNLAREFKDWLDGLCGLYSYLDIGELINRSWRHKKEMTPAATNERIDRLVEDALAAGACGAKVCGAGGGGFMLVVCEPHVQDNVRRALGLKELKFRFGQEGTKVVYED